MLWPLFVLLAAILLCAVLVRTMINAGVMDVPGHRSSHDRPIPKGGGIGIVTAFILGLPALRAAVGLPALTMDCLYGLCGIGLLAVVSWFDDVHSFSARHKLAAQTVAGILMLAGSDWLDTFTFKDLTVALLGLAWMIYVTNAVNFIDGINGLASGTMIVAATVVSVALLAADHTGDALPPLLMATCLLAFLPFNYPRASIFMGDVGSQSAGLLMGSVGLDATRVLPDPFLMPMLLFGVLYDVTFTLVRRATEGRSLTEAHRGHLYQLAVRSGWPASVVTLVHWGFAVWGGLVALLSHTVVAAILGIVAPQVVWSLIVLRQARRDVPRPW